jgi:hypothetical protein
MALLTDEQRAQVWRGTMRFWSQLREPVGAFNKTDLRSAVNATDQWIEDNAASYNAALPEPFRSEATAAQKTLLFCAVAAMRVSLNFARKLFGGLD